MRRPFFALLLLLLLTACPEDLENEPAYLLIDGIDLVAGNGEGAGTTDIREVWAFVDGEFIGAFPLPGRIPVFKLGEVTVHLEAGVRQDGRSVTPDIYPFYTSVERTLNLAGGDQIEIGRPKIRYRDNTVFGFVEDFESGTPQVFTDVAGNGPGIRQQTDVVRSGNAAGAITLTDSSRIFEAATGTVFSGLNTVPINVWLEVDFLAEAPTLFGVIGASANSGVRVFDPGFLPRSEWTKIYFNLGPVIGSANLEELRVALSSRLPDDLANGTVYLDNLKLLYFTP
ncbi:MAG: lipoprotein [Lewinella sp.]